MSIFGTTENGRRAPSATSGAPTHSSGGMDWSPAGCDSSHARTSSCALNPATNPDAGRRGTAIMSSRKYHSACGTVVQSAQAPSSSRKSLPV